jgi:hypothetical protein
VSGRAWKGRGWEVSVSGSRLVVTSTDGRLEVGSAEVDRNTVERRWWRWQLRYDGGSVPLRGLRAAEAAQLALALRRLGLVPQLAAAVAHGRGG